MIRNRKSGELTTAEKRVLQALDSEKGRVWNQKSLSETTGINEDAVMQTAFMLSQKGLCDVNEEIKVYDRITEEGDHYAEEGLPERIHLDALPLPLHEFKLLFHDEKEADIATNWSLRKGYARIVDKDNVKMLIPAGTASWLPPEVPEEMYPARDLHEEIVEIAHDEKELDERILVSRIKEAIPEIKDKSLKGALNDLVKKRKWLERRESVERSITITEAGQDILSQGISVEEEITQLTPELIRTGGWREQRFKVYDVNLASKDTFVAKPHPYQRILDRMRRILTEMGFVEIKGELIQSAFWNFDALFVPQDHPAREMQDTFYLATRKQIDASEGIIKRVKEMHEHGGSLQSTGWGGTWKRELGEELLLRTHTTAVTVNYLASHPKPPLKVFSIDRVYRRETIDPTHLPEFDQLEGIVMDKGVSFRNLLGCLATFYKKMGFPSIRFRPGYFPYTEPSVEVEVYMPDRGWLELGGAGIFREEVTNPVGVKYPVLAWGLGIGRLAMLSLGLTDIRDLYRSDIDWLKRTRAFQ